MVYVILYNINNTVTNIIENTKKKERGTAYTSIIKNK